MKGKVEEGLYYRGQSDVLLEGIQGVELNPPKMVIHVPKFERHLDALQLIFVQEVPPVVTVRSEDFIVIVYECVDAFGSGFGSTLLVKGNIKYQIGPWSNKEDINSSN